MFNKKWQISALVTLIIVLMITSVAYAVRTTINTNDGGVDSNWSSVIPFSNDGDDFADDNYDIDQAWMTNAPDNSAFYFRVSLVGSGRLPQDYSSFEARLDCNQNGGFTDAVDVVVYFVPDSGGGSEELVECQGSDYPQCDYAASNTSDTNPAAFGEEISVPPYNYEWQADVNNGDADWSQCLGQINVQFASLNSSFIEQESTSWRAYNVPTAVHLQNLAVKQNKHNYFILASALLAATAALSWVRRRKVGA